MLHVLRNLIGAIQHPRSEIRHSTSDIRHPRFDIRHLTSEIRHPTSDMRDSTCNIRHPSFDIRHLKGWPWCVVPGMAVMCSSWDQGTYEERFERKQCGLFWFCLVFLSFCIVAHAYITPVCSLIRKRAAKSYPFQVCTMNLLLHILLLHI